MNTFKLTKQHLILLKNANITFFDHIEFGAPAIDPKRPYGNSDVYKDIAKLLNIKGKKDLEGDTEFSDKQCSLMDKLHRELETALQICLVTGKFREGTYIQEERYNNLSWKRMGL